MTDMWRRYEKMPLFKVELNTDDDAGVDALTPRQREVVKYRVSGLSWAEVAAEMGLTQKTMQRYQENKQVKAAIKAEEDDIWSQVKILLVQGSVKSAQALVKILDSERTSPGHKIQASKVLLSETVRCRTTEDIELRLQELELAIEAKKEGQQSDEMDEEAAELLARAKAEVGDE
ncbi:sigma factor-like helix-turn-helix DNA-binding protein [Chroococcidiopsis sp. CCMEE 29]|uniref:sigma factor-like helix-turn-helix DNA-binding protein n=1 Tax=Chroococcidiopsis sp. CCMEE 29 TaxID=155894 RepID=UPI002022434E|nr:sigma factor-like helix-turn-helix DNA-binding protein [Chroococcidiopsis sp. CCMEE 29]